MLPHALQWHCIGALQRNKVRKVLPHFCLIHSIDSLRLAAYANEVAKEEGLYPAVLLQVNLAGELTKGGFSPDDLERDAETLFALDRLEIQGLMTVPPPVEKPEDARGWFSEMRQWRDTFSERYGVNLPILSMGMSGDFEVAIEEGATHVRVGSAIFGNRRSLA
jgi:pyridoxal phosphate enzyme (YggS family)